jgi:hypothetical protein
MPWDLIPINRRKESHVIPCDDAIDHQCVLGCWCQPFQRDEYGWLMVIHRSADGREEREGCTKYPRSRLM